MKESFWAIFVAVLGIVGILFIFVFQSSTNINEQNATLIREVTEAAMYDAYDVSMNANQPLVHMMDREKFVESFVRRFAESASLANTYKIEFLDINELPPKVSIRVSTKQGVSITSGLPGGEVMEFDIVNKLDAILETPY